MRYLIVSDIHGNLQALEAVLRESRGRYDRALCCGDLVGYGADPNDVVDWVRANCSAVVRGNHDRACTGQDDLDWFNPVARVACLWTQLTLTPENTTYVRELPMGPVEIDSFQIAHGSPIDEDAYVIEPDDALPVFAELAGGLVFFGHTHIQGGYVRAGERISVVPGADHHGRDTLKLSADNEYLINPGSVGQPRDDDPRAAFAIYDSDKRTVLYRRVAYDVAEAQRRIRNGGLPPALAERLANGR